MGNPCLPIGEICQPERIILCVDAACEDRAGHRTPIQQGGKNHSPFSILKKCAEAFLLNKSAMNKDHQFSILIFKSGVPVMTPFDSKLGCHLKLLQNVQPSISPSEAFNLSRMLLFIHDKVSKPSVAEETLASLRIVIFYGRSSTCTVEENIFSNCESVTIDMLYVHRPFLSAKEKKRSVATIQALKQCLADKSLSFVSQSDSFLPFKHTMTLLMHPEVRN